VKLLKQKQEIDNVVGEEANHREKSATSEMGWRFLCA